MSVCARCGATLGVGRFCTNCGHPVDAPVDAPADALVAADEEWPTATAERPAVPAEAPAARYPLYADEADTAVTTTGSHRAVTDRRPPLLPWLAGAVTLLLVAGLGAWLLFADRGDAPERSAGPATSASGEPGEEPDDGTEPAPSPTEETTSQEAEEPADVAGAATVSVPATAPPGQDTDGNPVRYDGDQMLDGTPDTCWRMPGDGSGETLTFTLDGPTALTSVGLVNGYAKTATEGGRRLDWYAGNRRVLAVVWEFDDGTTVSQDLDETRDPQTVEVDVTTESVELTLVTVSAPGTGPARRDYTAISEVSLVGTPG